MRRRCGKPGTGAPAVLLFVGWVATCAAGPLPSEGAQPPPRVDHILIEVKDLKTSLAFYRDALGLRLESSSRTFATLRAANLGVFLWTKHWDWEAPRGEQPTPGFGMYPHLEVPDVPGAVTRLRAAHYKVLQEAHEYRWGTEAFVADPDGYVWALVSLPNGR